MAPLHSSSCRFQTSKCVVAIRLDLFRLRRFFRSTLAFLLAFAVEEISDIHKRSLISQKNCLLFSNKKSQAESVKDLLDFADMKPLKISA